LCRRFGLRVETKIVEGPPRDQIEALPKVNTPPAM
jgi:hypothetical protein